MPLLEREVDLYPESLLTGQGIQRDDEVFWWAAYTFAKREKDLMRRLYAEQVAFYGPVIEQRYRTGTGRIRVSFKPLFPNYVFVCGTEEDRIKILKTNTVSNLVAINDPQQLCSDLRAVQKLIESGSAVTLEEKLSTGRWVRIKSGNLKGQEGFVVERRGEHRLVIAVDFLQQGASVLMNDFEVEPID